VTDRGKLDGVRILVVDDDPDILEIMSLALLSEDAVVRTAETGDDAILALSAELPQLIVLDMMLPKRSGFLVLEHVQEIPDAPPVIMVTANEGRRHKAYAESLGVSAYLNKPVPMEVLVDTALAALDSPRQSPDG